MVEVKAGYGGVAKSSQAQKAKTHGKLRVNLLVGDIVGNVLDLRIVFTGSGGHVGSSGGSGNGC